MMTLDAVPAATADISTIGVLYDLSTDCGVVATTGPDWQDHYTADSVVAGPTHVGLTTGPDSEQPVTVMERHLYTREALLPLTEPVVLPVCAEPDPSAAAVQALIVEPGQVLMLEVGVWHAPALGAGGPSRYYWLAGVDEHVESEWVNIAGGPLAVRVGAGP